MEPPFRPPRWQRPLWIAGAAVLLLLFAWQTRYRYLNDAGEGFYRIDRWTGRVVYVVGPEAVEVHIPGSPDPSWHQH